MIKTYNSRQILVSPTWIYKHTKYKSYGVMETSIKISKENLGSQVVSCKIRICNGAYMLK
jgi:hypothetical protein